MSANGPLDRAPRFVRVGAIRKTTMGHEGPKFWEEPFNFFRPDAPKLELANTRCVHDPASDVQLDELGRRRRMLALLVDLAHLTNLKPEPGLDGVQQR